MSDFSKRDPSHLLKLDPLKQSFIDSLDEGNAKTWLWMYFSGYTIDQIAEIAEVSKARVYTLIRYSVSKYNQFAEAEKERIKTAAKQNEEKPHERKHIAETIEKRGSASGKPPVPYQPKEQSKKIYARLKKRVEAQFDRKFFIGDIHVTDEEYAELLEYARFRTGYLLSVSAPLEDDPLLALALVQIGICRYNGNYWGNALNQELQTENTASLRRLLGEPYIRTLKKHNKRIVDESERVQSILFHAFVSDYYSKGLFELLFNYCCIWTPIYSKTIKMKCLSVYTEVC